MELVQVGFRIVWCRQLSQCEQMLNDKSQTLTSATSSLFLGENIFLNYI